MWRSSQGIKFSNWKVEMSSAGQNKGMLICVQQRASSPWFLKKKIPWIMALLNQAQTAEKVVLLHLLSGLHTHLLQSCEWQHHPCNVRASGKTSFTRWTNSSHSPTAKFSVVFCAAFFPRWSACKSSGKTCGETLVGKNKLAFTLL